MISRISNILSNTYDQVTRNLQLREYKKPCKILQKIRRKDVHYQEYRDIVNFLGGEIKSQGTELRVIFKILRDGKPMEPIWITGIERSKESDLRFEFNEFGFTEINNSINTFFLENSQRNTRLNSSIWEFNDINQCCEILSQMAIKP